jgi:hypothetical protein
MKTLSAEHKSLKLGTTLFLKQVKPSNVVKRILQPAASNAKLGGTITKGRWKGMPMYSLSLEERKTCPRTCQQWANCYGNNMPFANRIDHTGSTFLTDLASELQALSTKHPAGFVIRLHVLGDFYSTEYVEFWGRMLRKFSNLRIFGYTHREKSSPIGKKLGRLNHQYDAWIRWSDAGGEMSANVDSEGITCPEQLGKTKSCSTCGLCWSTTKAINFLGH